MDYLVCPRCGTERIFVGRLRTWCLECDWFEYKEDWTKRVHQVEEPEEDE